MKTKFTPKRWEIEPTRALNKNENPLYYDIVSDGQLLSSTHKNIYIEGMDDEMQLANAKLIAAAPEMFEELSKIMETYDKGTETYLRVMTLLTKITQ